MIPINELLHYLGADDGDDDVLLEMERNAVAFVERQTGRYFGPPELYEEVLTGNAAGRIWLSDVPIAPPDVSNADWGAVVISGTGTVATFAAGTILTDGIRAGMEIRFTNLSVSGNNSVWVEIATATETVLTFASGTLADNASDVAWNAEFRGALVGIGEAAQTGDTATDISDYTLRILNREALLARHGGVKWTRDYEYPVTYWRGYPAGEEPGDIRQLVLDLCSMKWAMKGKEGLKSETFGPLSFTRFGESDVDGVTGGWETIKSWRRPVFA